MCYKVDLCFIRNVIPAWLLFTERCLVLTDFIKYAAHWPHDL